MVTIRIPIAARTAAMTLRRVRGSLRKIVAMMIIWIELVWLRIAAIPAWVYFIPAIQNISERNEPITVPGIMYFHDDIGMKFEKIFFLDGRRSATGSITRKVPIWRTAVAHRTGE